MIWRIISLLYAVTYCQFVLLWKLLHNLAMTGSNLNSLTYKVPTTSQIFTNNELNDKKSEYSQKPVFSNSKGKCQLRDSLQVVNLSI